MDSEELKRLFKEALVEHEKEKEEKDFLERLDVIKKEFKDYKINFYGRGEYNPIDEDDLEPDEKKLMKRYPEYVEKVEKRRRDLYELKNKEL